MRIARCMDPAHHVKLFLYGGGADFPTNSIEIRAQHKLVVSQYTNVTTQMIKCLCYTYWMWTQQTCVSAMVRRRQTKATRAPPCNNELLALRNRASTMPNQFISVSGRKDVVPKDGSASASGDNLWIKATVHSSRCHEYLNHLVGSSTGFISKGKRRKSHRLHSICW